MHFDLSITVCFFNVKLKGKNSNSPKEVLVVFKRNTFAVFYLLIWDEMSPGLVPDRFWEVHPITVTT